MIIKDIIFQLSIRSIRLHFLRSVLAALGIVIGVVAIASMGMMGANMTLSVTEELSSMADTLVVTAYSGGGGGGGMPGMGGGGDDDDYISKDEFDDIERIAAKYGTVYAIYQESDTIEVGDKKGRATMYGLDEDMFPGLFTLTEGAFPRSTNSVIVGPMLVERLDLKVGSKIEIGDPDEGPTTTVRVVGILEERGMSQDINSDMAIIGAEKLFTGIFGGEGEYDQVNIVLNDLDDTETVTEQIEDKLNRKEDTVTIQDSSRMIESITGTLSTMTIFVMAIAGISLLVAAVSIFNVMMMSVTERIREIGILRSIGTQKNEVRSMFLYESAILGVIGAVIGAVVSLTVGWLVVLAMVGSTEYFFAPASLVYVPFAMAIGTVICILSGLYPAWSASNLDPIEALRAE
ncbi:MAG TPA: ABC transporter permease [Methanoregulaceae archaeon]|jgi:putative ABC transport system permease protein|nr:ABC transporter permease [Methanolinea sp.]MCC7567167.1 ABC transporter permease [Methanoregulaceae archaeon]MDD3091967.1 ABC transporter permease [Methanoregulaceae archaeon]MDD5048705.1 ABC transporter permease [Methanoregulaceae archaeon]MDD5685709.1 ABC transporter permease [Methanoregulaceae archaeon]